MPAALFVPTFFNRSLDDRESVLQVVELRDACRRVGRGAGALQAEPPASSSVPPERAVAALVAPMITAQPPAIWSTRR